MQLVKRITAEKIRALYYKCLLFFIFIFSCLFTVKAQDNSPYSRYGIGDLVPSTHIIGRGMGGISAGYADPYGLTINFNNPASYSSFQALREQKSKKIVSGRAILDVGLNFDSRTLREGSSPKFAANNALFSYIQVGVPIKPNWGLSFGLHPISRISYKIVRSERLKDPSTGLPIDSAFTGFEGDGGMNLASLGTGFKVKNFRLGVNGGYMFGKKGYKTKRTFGNDTIDYKSSNFETTSSFGGLYFDLGAQYKIQLNKKVTLTLGAYGNIRQKISATKDVIRETFVFDATQGDLRLDSVSDQRDVKGNLVYPASYTAGFIIQKLPDVKEGGWLFGIDFTQQRWDQYRFFGETDLVRDRWELRMGTELRPAPKRNYFSNVLYRAGFSIGPDYIHVNEKLSQFNISLGLGLPVVNYNRLSPGQATMVNLAFEYGKRGNNNNLLRENTFRFSLGFSLSDFWFIKRKYD